MTLTLIPFSPTRTLLFILFTLYFLVISRKALRNPRCHGFYRFFVFEGILFLVLHNYPFWFDEILTPRQMLSWTLLSLSVVFVILGLQKLRTAGGVQSRTASPENFSFENTTSLVTTGIYSLVRHPMYGSLLLLIWGTFFKHLSLPGLIVGILATLFMVITGLIEEKENLDFFGPPYLLYKKSTKMFLPFLI